MDRKEIEKLAYETDPNDGLRVREVKVGDELSLHLGFYVKGRPVQLSDTDPASREVWSRSNLKDKDFGDKDRARLMHEALCRFLNTGGKWSELNWIISEVKAISQNGQVKIDLDGFVLVKSEVNTDGVFEHLFAKDGCPFLLRWVEGQFIDVLTEVTLVNETRKQATEDEVDDAAGQQLQPGQGGPNRLLGPGGDQPSTEDGGGSE